MNLVAAKPTPTRSSLPRVLLLIDDWSTGTPSNAVRRTARGKYDTKVTTDAYIFL
jgi:hypothetical protein